MSRNKKVKDAADLLTKAILLLQEDNESYLSAALPSDPDVAADEGERFGMVISLKQHLSYIRDQLRDIR